MEKSSTLYCICIGATVYVEIILNILKQPSSFSLKGAFIMDPDVFTLEVRGAISSPSAYKKS